MAAANENILPQFHNARKNLANGELIFNKKKPFVTRASDNYLHNKSKVAPLERNIVIEVIIMCWRW